MSDNGDIAGIDGDVASRLLRLLSERAAGHPDLERLQALRAALSCQVVECGRRLGARHAELATRANRDHGGENPKVLRRRDEMWAALPCNR